MIVGIMRSARVGHQEHEQCKTRDTKKSRAVHSGELSVDINIKIALQEDPSGVGSEESVLILNLTKDI
jgi:hypothetical protein